MNDKKIASIISLCSRAGKLKSGERACEDALKNQEAFLILVSEDASLNTKSKFEKKAYFYNIPMIIYEKKERLGAMTGSAPKSSVAVTDENFAKMIIEAINGSSEQAGLL